MLALGIVLLLPRASVAQQLGRIADLLCRSLEPLGFGKALVLVSWTQSVDVVLESSVLRHRAERDQGVAKSVLLNVVRRPVVFLGVEAPSNGISKIAVVLFCATHVACSG